MQQPGWGQLHTMWHRQDVTAAVSEHPGEAGHLLSWSHSLCTTKKFGRGWAERYFLLGRAMGSLKLPHKAPTCNGGEEAVCLGGLQHCLAFAGEAETLCKGTIYFTVALLNMLLKFA